MVSSELSQQVAAFEEAIKALEEQTRRWATVGDFVIPDSSFFIQHLQKLEEVDFAYANFLDRRRPIYAGGEPGPRSPGRLTCGWQLDCLGGR
jgi:hypothetical protein